MDAGTSRGPAPVAQLILVGCPTCPFVPDIEITPSMAHRVPATLTQFLQGRSGRDRIHHERGANSPGWAMLQPGQYSQYALADRELPKIGRISGLRRRQS